MTDQFDPLRIADRCVAFATRYGVILSMLTLFVLLMIRIIARATEIPFAAYDEVGELATVWLIVLGTLALWREGALYRVTVLPDTAPSVARWSEIAIQALMLAFALILLWQGWLFTANSREVTAFMQIDKTYYYGAIPVTAALMCAYSLGGLVRAIRCAFSTAAPSVGAAPKKHGPTAEHL